MADNNTSIDDMWLNVLTGRDDSDVSGQFLNEEQHQILKDAELLREALISMNKKEQAVEAGFNVEKSKDKLIEKLKKKDLL